jgi:hypothetical protein
MPSAAECDRSRYGGGTWSGQGDLVVRVAKARLCSDPWVGQIYWNLYNRNPTDTECSASYGPRSSYMAMASQIQAYKAGGSAPAASPATMQAIGQADGSLRLANGTTVCPGGCLVASGGGNLTAVTPGMVVGLVASGGGNLVASGGGNFSLQSVGGHPHIAGTVIRK